MALAKTTQDHDEIRKWAEARGGKPAVVTATEGDDETGIIRLMFPNAPNHNDGALEEISWEEWFEKFDESGLELTYQEKTASGKQSDFNKLTYPDPDSAAGKKLLKKSASKKGSAKKSASAKTAAKGGATKTASKASTKSESKAASKTPGKKSAAKPSAEKKAPAKKSAAGRTASKSASKSASKTASKTASVKASSSERPARNYPKPEHGSPNGQVF